MLCAKWRGNGELGAKTRLEQELWFALDREWSGVTDADGGARGSGNSCFYWCKIALIR